MMFLILYCSLFLLIHCQSDFQSARRETNFVKSLPNSLETKNQPELNKTTIEDDMTVVSNYHADKVAKGPHNSRRRSKRNARVGRQWPDVDHIYFYIDSSLPARNRRASRLAAKFWTDNTCLTLIEIDDMAEQPEGIRFYNGDGCASSVGKFLGWQSISLGEGCGRVGIGIHEIAHALGFFHSHTRTDRDEYITIDHSKLDPIDANRVLKETASENYGYGYDYGSIMHYGADSLSKNLNEVVMFAKNPLYQGVMGSAIPSFIDIEIMNRHYSCHTWCLYGASCEGGIRNPKNCNACLCPRGLEGIDCKHRPLASGGSTLATTSSWQKMSDSVGKALSVADDLFTEKIWHIKSPVNTIIEIKMKNRGKNHCSMGCRFNGIEAKYKADKKYTGVRYCCKETSPVLTSDDNFVIFIAYSMYNKIDFDVEYRHISAPTENQMTTTATPSTRNSTEINDICRDNLNTCALFAKKGYCNSDHFTTVQKKWHCGKSCNMCCEDRSASCVHFVNHGFCQSANFTSAQKRDICPSSCGLC